MLKAKLDLKKNKLQSFYPFSFRQYWQLENWNTLSTLTI